MKASRLMPLLVIPSAVALTIVAPPSIAAAASDITLTLQDNLADGVEREYATAGSQVTYALKVENVGDEAANGAAVTMTLPAEITQATWTAVYAGDAVGPDVGAAAPETMVDLPAGGSATFTIVATIAADAVAELVATATVVYGAQTITATDTDRLLPASIGVSPSWGDDVPRHRSSRSDSARGPRVQLIDPSTSAVQTEFLAYKSGFRGGVQTTLGDLDGDGAAEVVVAPGPGRVGEVRVFPVAVDNSGNLTVSRDSTFDLRPFGSRYRGGIAVTAGDFDGDGLADLAVARTSGRGKVKVYVSRPSGTQPLELSRSFSPRPITGPSRVTLAAGDFGTFGAGVSDPLLPDGRDELVVAGGARSGGQVQIRDTSRSAVPTLRTIRIAKVSREGLHVSVARVSKDGIPDLIIAQRRGKTVKVVVRDGVVGDDPSAQLLSFTTGRHRTGAQSFAAGIDSDGDGRADAIHVGWVGRNGSRTSVLPILDHSTRSVTVGDAVVSPSDVHGPIGMVAAGSPPGLVTTASGLQYRDIVVGTGAQPSGAAPTVTIDYAAWLLDGRQIEGGSGVTTGLEGTIVGLQEGISTMGVGGRRQLIIPPTLAYGDTQTGDIPPNSTLVFDVQLLATT